MLMGPVLIIGVGNMGAAMALNLLRQGWPVHVRDLDAGKTEVLASKGAIVQVDKHSLATKNIANEWPNWACVIVCVVDAAQTQEVLFGTAGIAAQLSPGQTVMLCPTISPQDVARFAQQLGALGIHTLDAPMSGGPARAADGSMSLMLAGPQAVVDAQRSLLQALSSKRFHVSPTPGDGARTKLVNNLLAAVNLAGAAEALALAEQLGLDPAITLGVIAQSSGQSWVGSDRMPRALAGDFAPRAHMTLLAKDSALAQAAARQAGAATPMGDAAASLFAQALAHGLADQDDAALIALWRRRLLS
jgi:3-hydroxyisobutyrate dehydrogenase-like beta-hydroxyacid dehydrogenase